MCQVPGLGEDGVTTPTSYGTESAHLRHMRFKSDPEKKDGANRYSNKSLPHRGIGLLQLGTAKSCISEAFNQKTSEKGIISS